MLSGRDCIDVKFAEQFKTLIEEDVGLPELSLTDLELENKVLGLEFL